MADVLKWLAALFAYAISHGVKSRANRFMVLFVSRTPFFRAVPLCSGDASLLRKFLAVLLKAVMRNVVGAKKQLKIFWPIVVPITIDVVNVVAFWD